MSISQQPCVNTPFFQQDYIARFGHGSAKLARQAQSKEKVLAKMVSGGLTEKVASDKVRSHQPTRYRIAGFFRGL